MRALLFTGLVVSTFGAFAQAPAEAPEPAPDGRQNQRIERIRIEDAGSRVDELRVGGQTQSITVQPKADVPAYEVRPADGARSKPTAREGAGTGGGQRVWNVLNF